MTLNNGILVRRCVENNLMDVEKDERKGKFCSITY